MECRIIFCRNIIDLETHYDLSFAHILFIDSLIFYENKLFLKPFNFTNESEKITVGNKPLLE